MENETEKNSAEKKADKNETRKTFSVMALAWELGYLIAIPLVALTLGGRGLDKKLGTSPLLLLIGVVAAIILSSYMVYKKTIDIMDQK